MTWPCPSLEILQQHLAGTLAQAEEAQVIAHLDECATCQQTLDALASGDESLLSAARHVAEGTQDVESELQRVLHDLKKKAAVDESLGHNTGHGTVDFLGRSELPGHLGRLDHYEILEIVGQGGMGIVLKAFDEKLNRLVAVKVMSSDLADSASARGRFNREAKSAAAVVHEHVVTIHAVEDKHCPPYLVMEFVKGQSLQQRLDERGPLELKEILRIGQQTASGLAASHSQGVIHRDIKPANILLENGIERVKITDFGLNRTTGRFGLLFSPERVEFRYIKIRPIHDRD